MGLQAPEQSPVHAMIQSDVMALAPLARRYPFKAYAYRFDAAGNIKAVFGLGEGHLYGVAHANGNVWFTGTRTDKYVGGAEGEYKNAWRVDNDGVIQAAADLPTERPGGTADETAVLERIAYDGTGLHVVYKGTVTHGTRKEIAHKYVLSFNAAGAYASEVTVSDFCFYSGDTGYVDIIESTQTQDVYIPHYKWKMKFPDDWPNQEVLFPWPPVVTFPSQWGDSFWVFGFDKFNMENEVIDAGELIYDRTNTVSKITHTVLMRAYEAYKLNYVASAYLGLGIAIMVSSGPGLVASGRWKYSAYNIFIGGAHVVQYHFLHRIKSTAVNWHDDKVLDYWLNLHNFRMKSPDGVLCVASEPFVCQSHTPYGRSGYWYTARNAATMRFVGVPYVSDFATFGQQFLDFMASINPLEAKVFVYYRDVNVDFGGTAAASFFLTRQYDLEWNFVIGWRPIFKTYIKLPGTDPPKYEVPNSTDHLSSNGVICIYADRDEKKVVILGPGRIEDSELPKLAEFAYPPSGYTGTLRRVLVHGGLYWLLGDWAAGGTEYVILICNEAGAVVKTYVKVAGTAWGQNAPLVAQDPDTNSVWIVTNGEIMEYIC